MVVKKILRGVLWTGSVLATVAALTELKKMEEQQGTPLPPLHEATHVPVPSQKMEWAGQGGNRMCAVFSSAATPSSNIVFQVRPRSKELYDGIWQKALKESSPERRMFMEAVDSGDAKKVCGMIAASPKLINASGMVADVMQRIISKGDVEMVKALAAAGVDMNAKAGYRDTPMGMAVLHGQVDVVTALLEMNAKPLDLLAAASRSPSSVSEDVTITILQKFMDAGAKIDDSRSPVFGTLNWDGITAGAPKVLKFLIDKGANVNVVAPFVSDNEYGGRTPLMRAAELQNDLPRALEVYKLLLDAKADVNAQDEGGHTALHHAAYVMEGKAEVLRFLIARGADPAIKDKKGRTALDLAGDTWAQPEASPAKKYLRSIAGQKPKEAPKRQ